MGDLINKTCSNATEIWSTGAGIWIALVHLRTAIPQARENASEWYKLAIRIYDLLAGNYGSATNGKRES